MTRTSSRMVLMSLMLVLALLVGTGIASAQEEVHLRYTYWGSPLEQKAQEDMIKSFMEAYPHIKVQPIYIPSGDYVTRISAMMAAGNPPDVGQLGEGQALPWAEEGAVMDLVPFMEKDPDVSFESRVDVSWYMFDGGKKTLGTNLAVETTQLFYNKEIFDERGVPYPPAKAEEWTWDQFVETARALTVDRNGRSPGDEGFNPNQIQTYGVAFGTGFYSVLPFVLSNGGNWFNEEGTEPLINQAESVEAMQKLADLMHVERVAPTPTQMENFPAFNVLLQTRRVGMVINGQWALLDLAQAGFDLGVAPLPYHKKPVSFQFGGPNVIFSGTQHPEEAWLLYKWTTTASSVMPLIQDGLWMPLQTEYYTDPDMMAIWLKEGVHPPEYKEAVIDYLRDYGYRSPTYYTRNWAEINRAISQGLSNFWLGREDAQTAADRVAKEMAPLLEGRYDK